MGAQSMQCWLCWLQTALMAEISGPEPRLTRGASSRGTQPGPGKDSWLVYRKGKEMERMWRGGRVALRGVSSCELGSIPVAWRGV